MSKQAVVEKPDAPAKQESEGEDAQSLDDLLNQFETETEETSTPEKADPMVKEVYQHFLDQQIAAAVKTVKDAAGLDVDDQIVRDLLEGRAQRDTRFRQAFVQRRSNPGAWNKILNSVGAEYASHFKIDRGMTETTDQVVSAVQGATTSRPESNAGPSDKDIRRMSDAEFHKYTQELMRD